MLPLTVVSKVMKNMTSKIPPYQIQCPQFLFCKSRISTSLKVLALDKWHLFINLQLPKIQVWYRANAKAIQDAETSYIASKIRVAKFLINASMITQGNVNKN